MCGIAGIITASSHRFNRDHIETMTSSLKHRGPDGQLTWCNSNQSALLGHRRLSIIDLSVAAAQPMHYKERYSIVHNGEIYNYIELSDLLKSKGYSFSTKSDTEVILAAYDYFKEKCLEKFEGMFAFAIWDEHEKTLFAARDRFGEKPFYYQFDSSNKTFAFASEIKALWSIGIRKEVDEQMLLLFLSLGMVSHPEDNSRSFYKNIFKLRPAHYLKWSLNNKQPEIFCYWQLDKNMVSEKDESAAIEEFQSLFNKSVCNRLRADVNIGTSLSGGLDSSSIVATIHGLRSNNNHYSQQAFTAAFNGFDKDESAWATKVSDQFNLHQHFSSITTDEFANELEDFILHHEEPLDSASSYAQYKVFELAKNNNVKVLLDGQGADETLAGYQKYIHWYLQQLLANGLFGEFAYEKRKLEANKVLFDWDIKNWLAAAFPSNANKRLQKKASNQLLSHSGIQSAFIQSHLKDSIVYKPVIKNLNDILYYNTMQSGLNDLLRYADKNSMAHGREVRLPFLHHELVQFVFSLPASLKIKDGYTKWILRQSMKDKLPKEIVWRTDKIGFEPPQQAWMENKLVQQKIRASKEKLVALNILKKSELDKKIQPHSAYAADRNDWRYLVSGILLS